MKKNEKNEIELLEEQLSQTLGVYKKFKNSKNNERYFENLHYKIMNKVEEKKSKTGFSFNPAISYALLFIISFAISFQLINFNSDVPLDNNESYLFSDGSLWLEEEEFLSDVWDEEVNLDYTNYLSYEIDFIDNSYWNDEMKQLTESEFDEIYKNLKYKKIL